MKIQNIRKRDGRVVKFDRSKITGAIHKALIAVEQKDGKKAEVLSKDAVSILEKKFRAPKIPSVEDAQNAVLAVLKKRGYKNVVDEYRTYMQRKREIRNLKKKFGIEEEPKLTVNAIEVLRRRYLLRDEKGGIVETPAQLFRRVARALAKVDKMYGEDPKKSEEEFYRMMSKLEFIPNTPTMFNAGAPLGQLAACFVLPVEDSLEGIFTSAKHTALIEQTGGGVGFDFSRLRPRGDIVRSTKGVASGPVTFMKVFDTVTEVIKAGGKRRGAMMGILRVDHPDILEFITEKAKEGALTNFNVSVAVTDKFMRAVQKDTDYELISPRTGKVAGKLNARRVWNLIAEYAWRTGDPGVIFIDEIARWNPTPKVGQIRSTNPCAEVPLLDYESCNLGSINVGKMVKAVDGKYEIDWEKLDYTVKVATHFLDNVVSGNKYPIPEIEQITKANRKIGLGIMGWAELLILLKIPYDSEKAVRLGDKLMKFIHEKALEKSVELANERGAFPNFKGSRWDGKYKTMRNATVTTIAPTGTISIIAGCSSGIEPLFAVSFMRKVLEGTKLFEVNPIFERIAKERGFYSVKLLEKIARSGSVQKFKEVPKDVRRLFGTAFDIAPEWHVRMQAVFQKHVDNAVSKTINMPHDSKISDVKKIYELAWKLKCKGITIYRYGSKKEQVLYIGEIERKKEPKAPEFVSAEPEYAGGCATKTCPFPD